jgi:hypothetical protein
MNIVLFTHTHTPKYYIKYDNYTLSYEISEDHIIVVNITAPQYSHEESALLKNIMARGLPILFNVDKKCYYMQVMAKSMD